MSWQAVSRLLALSALFAAACEVPGGGDPGEPEDKISTNGLSVDFAALGSLDPAPLGARWLSDADVAASAERAESLGTSERGRELLRYLAKCALPARQTLIVESPQKEAVYEMPGLAGLAPEWSDERCDEDCRHWISACLLAHANGRDKAVEISLRGEHPELGWTESIEAEFDVEEAAFYGDLFAEEPEAYACVGRGLFEGSWAEQTSYLEGRVCGLNGNCGLHGTGSCHSITGEGWLDSGTCRRGGAEGRAYGDCHIEAGNKDSPFYAEVVTVYLEGESSLP